MMRNYIKCSFARAQFWKRSGAWFYRSVPLPGFKMPQAKPKCAEEEEETAALQKRRASGSFDSPGSPGSHAGSSGGGGTHTNVSPISSIGALPATGTPAANNVAASTPVAAAVGGAQGPGAPGQNAQSALVPPPAGMSESDSDDELNATRRRPRHTIRYATTNNSRMSS